MPKKSRTSYFTKRGEHFGNLWAVFSSKTNQVLLLGSDRQLAHWLLNLEFCPSVKDFSFQPGYKDLGSESEGFRIDYHVEVVPDEGAIQLHYLQVDGLSDDYSKKREVAKKWRYEYREYNDEDWRPYKARILPLLKLSSFISGGRNNYIPEALLHSSRTHINVFRRGSLKSYLSALSVYDENTALLVFARMYLEGYLQVEFERSFFDQDMRWWINEK